MSTENRTSSTKLNGEKFTIDFWKRVCETQAKEIVRLTKLVQELRKVNKQ